MTICASAASAWHPASEGEIVFEQAGWRSVMNRDESWDWSRLRALCLARGLTEPNICYLGNAINLNNDSIAFPWVAANEKVHVSWLGLYDDAPLVLVFFRH